MVTHEVYIHFLLEHFHHFLDVHTELLEIYNFGFYLKFLELGLLLKLPMGRIAVFLVDYLPDFLVQFAVAQSHFNNNYNFGW